MIGAASWYRVTSVAGSNGETIQLPGDPGKSLVASDVNFKASAPYTFDDDAACTGTISAPTAPPGKVCLYLSASSPDTADVQGSGFGRYPAFRVSWYDSHTLADADVVHVDLKWAYTAP